MRQGGVFHFTVPDIAVWCEYLLKYVKGKSVPFTIDHIKAAFYGWQRWDGDEHKWGWLEEELKQELASVGFSKIYILKCDFGDPGNAHLLCKAYEGVHSLVHCWKFQQAGTFERILLMGIRLVFGFLPLWVTRPLSNLVRDWLNARTRNFAFYATPYSSAKIIINL